MPRPVHFEIPAGNPEQAAKFYGDVFGWTFQKWDGPMEYWLVTTGPDSEPGINGGLMKKCPESDRVVNTIGVDSVDDSVAKITAAGGAVAAPKMAIPGIGWLAYCTDLDGNLFGIMQNDPAAA
jgi:hypothetical protein